MTALLTVLRICRGHWRWLTGGILLGLLVIAANIFLMALSGWFIASMAVAGASGLAFNYQLPAAAIRALAIVRTLGRYAERLVTHEAALRVLADLRVWFFRRLTPLAPAGLENYGTGDLTGRLRADVDALENLYLRIIAPLVTGILSIVCGVAIAATWSGSVAGMLLAALAVAGLLLPLLVRRLAKRPGETAAALSGDLRTALTESIDGCEELLILGAADRQTEQLTRLSARLVAAQQQLARIGAMGQAGSIACSGIALAAVLALAGSQVADGSMAGPVLVMLLLFSGTLFEASALLPAALHAAPATVASLQRILQVTSTPPPLAEPAEPRSCPVAPLPISLHDARCIYLPEHAARQSFTLAIAAGERVALVGASGAGKSTIIELLLRFRPYTGRIFIGDAELRDIADDSVRQLVAALPQTPHLFNATIRENILLARPEASADELAATVADAGLADWIAELPEGLATQVGEQGHLVSGGEARRIALARTLLSNAPIVLLDEPTEGLDTALERHVVARLAQRLAGKTVLVATHRRACLALADRVITMEECCRKQHG